ncbi:hypothetical protein ABBQ38_009426 [Trebouxia sp. C0009 RCD-2024]
MTCLVLPQAKTFKEFERSAFTGDDKLSVDRLVLSCQPEVMAALPGAGRDLVPYFSSPGDCVNETLLSQSHIDPARKRKKSGKKTSTTSANPARLSGRETSPGKPVTNRLVQKQPDYTTGSVAVRSKRPQASGTDSYQGASPGNAIKIMLSTPKGTKAWAGPSYNTSPPPEHLPMPTLFLLAV